MPDRCLACWLCLLLTCVVGKAKVSVVDDASCIITHAYQPCLLQAGEPQLGNFFMPAAFAQNSSVHSAEGCVGGAQSALWMDIVGQLVQRLLCKAPFKPLIGVSCSPC